MKALVFTLFAMLLVSPSRGDDRIAELEARIRALEAQKGMENGLKVKDMQGSEASSSRSPASSGSPQIPPEEQKKIMEQLEQFKAKQKEAQKLLDDLEAEGF